MNMNTTPVYMSIYGDTAYLATKPIEEMNGVKAVKIPRYVLKQEEPKPQNVISPDIAERFFGGLQKDYVEQIKKVVITEPLKPESTAFWFSGMKNLKEITGINLVDTSEVKNMMSMFSDCKSLKSIDLSNLDTSNTETMFKMFAGCESLEKLDLSNFNTHQVKDMALLFLDCKQLKEINLSSFDTVNTTNMAQMFKGCESLTSLDLSKFEFTQVNSFMQSFFNCKNLDDLKISRFGLNRIEERLTFDGCDKLYGKHGNISDKEMFSKLIPEDERAVFLKELNSLKENNHLFTGTVTINQEDFKVNINTQTQMYGVRTNNNRILTPEENKKIAIYASEIKELVQQALENSKNAIFIKDLTESENNKFKATLILKEYKYKIEFDANTKNLRYHRLGEDGKQFEATKEDYQLITSYVKEIATTIKNVLERQQKMKEASAPSLEDLGCQRQNKTETLEDKINAAKNKKAEKSINATTKVKKDIER